MDNQTTSPALNRAFAVAFLIMIAAMVALVVTQPDAVAAADVLTKVAMAATAVGFAKMIKPLVETIKG